MVVRRNKKTLKQRGSRVMGYGRSGGGHRASGDRGGKGKAGGFKHHQIWRLQERSIGPTSYRILNRGFVRNASVVEEANVWNVETLNNYMATALLESPKTKIEVNLADFGVDKLLGKGILKSPSKVTVTVGRASEKAKQKVKAAGGEIIETKPPVAKEPKEKPKKSSAKQKTSEVASEAKGKADGKNASKKEKKPKREATEE